MWPDRDPDPVQKSTGVQPFGRSPSVPMSFTGLRVTKTAHDDTAHGHWIVRPGGAVTEDT